jgi:hypothetical protein
MANQGSKGNKKRNSALQKQHYKSHYFRITPNKIARLRRHIKRNAAHVAKRAAKGVVIAVDQQAINKLKSLTN